MTGQVTDFERQISQINGHRDTRWLGVYPARVVDNQDPDKQGRVKVRLPWSPDGSSAYETWARLATTMAGNSRGTWFVPDTDDEVLVAFGGGNPDHPFVVGALWNGQDSPPQAMDSGNNVKAIVSRNDIRVSLDDTQGAETLTLSTPGGQKLTLTDGGSTIRLEDSNGNSLEMAPDGVTLTVASRLVIQAATISISSGTGDVDSAIWTYSGVVEADTVIANSVISDAYTPGAGNVW
jgi:uncharacterized protein involved in type VI secretion and phage assembly